MAEEQEEQDNHDQVAYEFEETFQLCVFKDTFTTENQATFERDEKVVVSHIHNDLKYARNIYGTKEGWVPSEHLALFEQKKDEQRPKIAVVGEEESDERPRSIKVTDLPESVSIEDIENFLENKRKSGGGSVENVELDPLKNQAIVTFGDASAVVGEEESDERPRSIKVTDLPESVSIEDIENFFENRRKSGGGSVENVELDALKNQAIVTFEDASVAEMVLRKNRLLLKEKLIKVEIYEISDFEDEFDDVENEEHSNELCTIEVRNYKTNTDEDSFMMYFENQKRSGGGPNTVTMDEENERVLVTFESSEVAERVCQKKNHKLGGAELKVSLYIPPPPPKPRETYPNKVIITNLNPETDRESLINFIEAKSGLDVLDVEYGPETSAAILTFGEKVDFDDFKKKIVKRKLKEQILNCGTVPVVNSITVECNKDFDEETLLLYFENKRKSGGGDVEKIDYDDSAGAYVVTFEDCAIIDDVSRRTHTLKGERLTVKVFYDCFGCTQNNTDKGPKHNLLEFPILDPFKYKFLTSPQMKKEVSELLAKHYGIMNMQSSNSERFVIECTLKKEDADYHSLWRNWKKNAETCFKEIVDDISIKSYRPLKEVFDEILEEVKKISDEVYMEVTSDEITIVGRKQQLAFLQPKIEKVIDEAVEALQRKSQTVEDIISSVEPGKLGLLLASKFDAKMKQRFKDLVVDVDTSSNKITFKGMPTDVTNAKLAMYEMHSTIRKITLDIFSDNKIYFLDTQTVKQYLSRKFDDTNFQDCCFWCTEGRAVAVFAYSDQDLHEASNILKTMVVESKVSFKQDSVPLLASKKWQDKVTEINDSFNGLVELKVDTNALEVQILTTQENIGSIMEIVKDFFFFNTIKQNHFELEPGIVRFLSQEHNKDILDIQQRFREQNLKIELIKNGIKINGTDTGLQSAQKEIDELIVNIIVKNHTIEKPGIGKYLITQGKDKLQRIERRQHCIIEVGNANSRSKATPRTRVDHEKKSVPQVFATCITKQGPEFKVMLGDLTELKVDVMVNAANKDLDHVGGIAKIIVDKGGKSIQEECKEHMNSIGQLLPGDIYLSKPGKLGCKAIAHAVGPVWSDGYSNESSYLEETIYKCIDQCNEKGYQSIAFPAVSTGVFSYPVREATEVIVQTLKMFIEEKIELKIKHIYLCDISSDTVNAFVQAIKKVFKGINITDLQERKKLSEMKLETKLANNSSGTLGRALKKNVDIRIVKGDLSEQKADVLVNTTSNDLNLSNGAVSSSVLKAAGQELQDMCNDRYPEGIQYGDIAITTGGQLNCLIFHGALENWREDGSSLTLMRLFVDKCLTTADMEGKTSIAFPALGTGGCSFPKDVVAKELFEAVSDFSTTSACTLKEVIFVIYDKDEDVYKAFKAEENQRNPSAIPVGGSSRQARNFKTSDKQYADANPLGKSKGTDKSESNVRIGKMTMKIQMGDITKSKVDAIVNSTDKRFSNTGAVATALARIGGKPLSDEMKGQRGQMLSKGIAITTSGSGSLFPFSYIIHLATENLTANNLKSNITKCFQLAQENRCTSLAFPALGAGNRSIRVDDLVKAFFETTVDFQAKSTCLHEIGIVIFEKTLMKDFDSKIKEFVEESQASHQPGFFGRLMGMFKTDLRDDLAIEYTEGQQQNMTVHLTIYTKNEANFNAAIADIEKICESDFSQQIIEDAGIKCLDNDQIMELQNMRKTHSVEIIIEKRLGRIRLRGLPDFVPNATAFVYREISRANEKVQQEEAANLFSDMVSWNFLEITSTGQEMVSYPSTVNLKIERAFKQNKPNTTFVADGKTYVLDFQNMEEYPLDDPTDKVKVIRKDKVQDQAFQLPPSWDQMKEDENVSKSTLQPSSQEYQNVLQNFNQTLGSNKATVTKIERIQNKILYQQFESKKKFLQTQNPQGHQNERILWHGTAAGVEDSINTYGFNRSYCGKNGTAYGNGVYFAVNSSYSVGYAAADSNKNRRMYQCRVLTGEYTQGKSGILTPPVKQGHILFDSVVDNPSNTQMFVVFNDTQAYPEYLLTFN